MIGARFLWTRRLRFMVLFAALATAATQVEAQAQAPAAVPAGGAALPTAPAATGEGPQATPPANPHGAASAPASRDTPELPAGVIEVVLLDPQGTPISGTEVRLGILQSSIEQGDSRSEQMALSDPLGKATFRNLQTTTDFSYRVTVTVGPAQFGSAPFPLRRDMGRREMVTLYPITRNQKDAQVVGRGVTAIHPRDDVFVIDVLYQLINIGKVAWVPEQLFLKLPSGWKAFTAQEGMGDTAFQEASDVGAKLLGTFTPGSHEVGFRFQLPNPHQATLGLTMPLLPRTIEMRVIVDAASEMTLSVPGYGDSFADRLRSGQRVLVAQKNYLERREASPETLSITIGGMRTRGDGHRVALALALAIALFGVWNAWQGPSSRPGKTKLAAADLEKARSLLLDELVALERAREQKTIGSKAYGQTRQVLVTSLARLESASGAI